MVNRYLRTGVLAVALMAPVTLHAQTSLVVMGGLSAPVSRLGDITDIGYNVAAGINVAGPAVPVGLRFEGAYNGFGFKTGSGSTNILSGTANALFSVGPGRDAPYIIAGLGLYNRSSNGYGSSKTAVGINGGGGLRFPLPGFSTFLEARYHLMLGNAADATNFQFIPITFGIAF